MPCSPEDLTITEPSGPAAPQIPGFGSPFAPPDISSALPGGFPEDLLNILDTLQMILPPGIIKPALNPNFGKDYFDGIMKLLDQFFPFLMAYKFFLPVLELIICIIEVLCAIPNPFKLIRALKRLFRNCLPAFLSLFPIFAMILMLISLLLLLLALIEYIIEQIIKLVDLLLQNIRALKKATTKADGPSILAITKKIGIVLCAFQNFFVLLSIFKAIIDIIKDVLALLFKIPPCGDSNNADPDNCCTTDVCPAFIRNNEQLIRNTGSLQYFNQVAVNSGLILPPAFGNLTFNLRNESWEFYDAEAVIEDALINITQAYDLPPGINQIFFPTEGTYTATTPPNQAPYTVDIRFFYDPTFFGRIDPLGKRFVRIKDCIVTQAPTTNLITFNNGSTFIKNGVIKLAGGSVFEDDGIHPFVLTSGPTSIESFIHFPATIGNAPQLFETDGYTFGNLEYIFKINHEVLLQKSLITLGCIPSVAVDRTVINTIFGGNVGVNFNLLNNLALPDIGGAQDCLQVALTNLRSNVSAAGVATFQAQTTVCLNKLKDDTSSALEGLIGIGFDPNASKFTLDPAVQFTSQAIKVKVTLNERNGQPLVAKFPAEVANKLASKITSKITLGVISNFTYDGNSLFIADLTSDKAGSGTIKIAFEGNTFSTVTIPTDITQNPTVTEQQLSYQFIYAPSLTDGKPARDEGDVSRDSEE